MPGGNPLRLGPFVGGLNLGSDPTAIADAELVTLQNFNLDIDGSLVSRPPLLELEGHALFTERIVMLCEAVFSGVHYLIGSNSNGVFSYLNGVWSTVTTTFRASCAVQYADQVYLVPFPGSGNPGGKWSPTGGFVAVAAIPQGGACAIHKERLFIVPGIAASTNTSRLQFTDAGNFDVWPAPNFIDVGQGDGTSLVDITVYQDNILMFKNQSSYVLAYDIRPADAVVKRISETIGVDNQHCLLNYENQVYCLHNGWVYEIINLDFQRLNTKVPFVNDQTSPSPLSAEKEFLALVGDRLIVRFFARVYVYGLRTRTWSEWTSAKDKLKFFGPVETLHQSTGNEYYAGSAIQGYLSVVRLFDMADASHKEQILDPVASTTDTFTRTVANGWGSADTLETWTRDPVGGAAADFSVTGTRGKTLIPTKAVARYMGLSGTYSDVDIQVTVSMSQVATGADMYCDLWGRVQGFGNTGSAYLCRLDFSTTSAVAIQVYKIVVGAATLLGSTVLPGTYVANEQYTLRLRMQGGTVKARAWKTASAEPPTFAVSVLDAQFATGQIEIGSFAVAGNTNVNPFMEIDNFLVGNMNTGVLADITCRVQTKNFDMAVPNQYKQLWYWGADVITNRNVVGVATPIIISFAVKWSQLATVKWSALKTWAQPLTDSGGVSTTVMTETGTSRRFVKFGKGKLRYRQINFAVTLLTDGSTGDGPARLFTMTVVTGSKQGVSKGLT